MTEKKRNLAEDLERVESYEDEVEDPASAKYKKNDPIMLRQIFAAARQELKTVLVERDEEIDLILTALIAQEHPLLVGPPGTAKSLLLDSILRWMKGADRFSILFTKFTTPEEVFGPISVQGLKSDQYRRITAGKLPEAHVAFLDEIFKASSAILNTTLRILNERVFENGDGKFSHCPLLLCVAASNEWPGEDGNGKELGALFDRFLFRKRVKPVSIVEGRKKLLQAAVKGDPCKAKFSSHLTEKQIGQAHTEAMQLPIPDATRAALWHILETLNNEGIFPGDRRLYKSIGAARSYAWLCGADKVDVEHLEILQHVLWDDPNEQPEKCSKIVTRIANPIGYAINEKLIVAQDVVAKNSATDAVPKLQSIQRELKALSNDPRKERAVALLQQMIKQCYNKVVQVEEE